MKTLFWSQYVFDNLHQIKWINFSGSKPNTFCRSFSSAQHCDTSVMEETGIEASNFKIFIFFFFRDKTTRCPSNKQQNDRKKQFKCYFTMHQSGCVDSKSGITLGYSSARNWPWTVKANPKKNQLVFLLLPITMSVMRKQAIMELDEKAKHKTVRVIMTMGTLQPCVTVNENK